MPENVNPSNELLLSPFQWRERNGRLSQLTKRAGQVRLSFGDFKPGGLPPRRKGGDQFLRHDSGASLGALTSQSACRDHPGRVCQFRPMRQRLTEAGARQARRQGQRRCLRPSTFLRDHLAGENAGQTGGGVRGETARGQCLGGASVLPDLELQLASRTGPGATFNSHTSSGIATETVSWPSSQSQAKLTRKCCSCNSREARPKHSLCAWGSHRTVRRKRTGAMRLFWG